MMNLLEPLGSVVYACFKEVSIILLSDIIIRQSNHFSLMRFLITTQPRCHTDMLISLPSRIVSV